MKLDLIKSVPPSYSLYDLYSVCCQLQSFFNIIFCCCFKSLQSAAHFSLDDQFKNDCYFFDALCRQNDLQDIFRSKVQLYPPDLVKTTSGLEHKK